VDDFMEDGLHQALEESDDEEDHEGEDLEDDDEEAEEEEEGEGNEDEDEDEDEDDEELMPKEVKSHKKVGPLAVLSLLLFNPFGG